MTDENGHRSVPVNGDTTHGSSYVEAATEMGSAAINKMAPADKGWILASVVLMLGLTGMILGTNYLDNVNRADGIEKFLVVMEEHRSEENRRLQEQNKTLANALARQSDRLGRQAIESTRNKEIQGVVEGFEAK